MAILNIDKSIQTNILYIIIIIKAFYFMGGPVKKYIYVMAILLLAMQTYADSPGLIIKAKSSTTTMGMGGIDTDIVSYMTSDFKREESYSTVAGFMQMIKGMAEEQDGITITRPEDDINWKINMNDSTVKEMSLSSISKMTQKDTTIDKYEIFKTAEQREMEDGLKQITWKTITDSSTEPELVNGFLCRWISYLSESEQKDQTDYIVYSKIYWCDYFPRTDIVREYHKKQYAVMGGKFGDFDYDIPSFFGSLMKQYAEVEEITCTKGIIPIKSIYEIRIKSIDSVPDFSDSSEIVKVYADDTALAGLVKDNLAGLSEFLSDRSDEEYISLISMTSEILEIRQEDLPDSLFQIPDGFLVVD